MSGNAELHTNWRKMYGCLNAASNTGSFSFQIEIYTCGEEETS